MEDRWFDNAFQIFEATDENDLEAVMVVLRGGTLIEKTKKNGVLETAHILFWLAIPWSRVIAIICSMVRTRLLFNCFVRRRMLLKLSTILYLIKIRIWLIYEPYDKLDQNEGSIW